MLDIEIYESMETTVCCDCVVDVALIELVQDNVSSMVCSYCSKGSSSNPAATFEIVVERVMAAVGNYFGDANLLGVPWDREFVIDQIYPDAVVAELDPGWSGQFLTDIISCVDPEIYWVQKAQGGWMLLDPEETMTNAWIEFKEVVLKKTRYFFESERPNRYDDGRPDYVPVKNVLENIGRACGEIGLLETIPAGMRYFRARACDVNLLYTEFDEVGVAPHAVTGSGRMNPAGIPYLYLAEDPHTAIMEIDDGSGADFSLADFETTKSLCLLNLVEPLDLPSKFLVDSYDKRHEIKFFEEFAESIALPVEKNGREHVDYVPSQIVSEYFRFVFKHANQNIDGIRFRSSKPEGGVCVSLFVSTNDEARRLLSLIGTRKHC